MHPATPSPEWCWPAGSWAQGQTARAEVEVAALLKAYPNASRVRALNGALKASKKDFSGARGEYERALQLDANSIEALTGLVMLDLTQKNVAAARARVETTAGRPAQ